MLHRGGFFFMRSSIAEEPRCFAVLAECDLQYYSAYMSLPFFTLKSPFVVSAAFGNAVLE